MKYFSVNNPRFISTNTDYIECSVLFEDLGVINFIAYRYDAEPHSRKLYNDIISGFYGEIAAYTPVEEPKPTQEDLAENIRYQRNNLLTEIDIIVINPFRFNALDEIAKAELANYRQQLLDITAQADFPNSVVWPTKPQILMKKTNNSSVQFRTSD